jgi:hypothetical protein
MEECRSEKEGETIGKPDFEVLAEAAPMGPVL